MHGKQSCRPLVFSQYGKLCFLVTSWNCFINLELGVYGTLIRVNETFLHSFMSFHTLVLRRCGLFSDSLSFLCLNNFFTTIWSFSTSCLCLCLSQSLQKLYSKFETRRENMMDMSFKVTYLPGKANKADALSRVPMWHESGAHDPAENVFQVRRTPYRR